jgi:hypothetical protein
VPTRAAPRLRAHADRGAGAVELHYDVPLVGRDMTSATFTVKGDSVPFTLSYHR